MRAVVQRVSEARVMVGAEEVARIGAGLLAYVGVAVGDGPSDVELLAEKLRYLRIFQDQAGKMNLDVGQVGGEVLLVSNFTLLADSSHGRRPAFIGAAAPDEAERLFNAVGERLMVLGMTVRQGRFRAMMRVWAANEGPINIVLDTRGPA